ncbi:MAG TPA: ABC transporter ATP-binding protein [Solirubrobacteraceae bacterium]|nr:ABC transporter ATP-binding protein [Solirubrobacteraceae bacterium]
MSAIRPLLSVRDLHVEYGSGRRRFQALRGVSFDLADGETLGVVGESGSGKTTIARAILGLAKATAGTIQLGDMDLTGARRPDRRELARMVQVVFQDPLSSLNPALRVGATLAEPFRAARGGGAAEAAERAAQLLERVGLDRGAAGQFPLSFSGGQRQRIAIARALMPSPRLVICDEAVSALDLSVQAQVLNLLRGLQREFELSYLFISHDLDVVRYMAHRVIVVYRGRVLEHGSAAAVSHQPRHPYTQALVAAAPGRGAELGAARARPNAGATEEGCPFAPRCRFAVARCTTEIPELGPLHGGGAAACHRLEEVPVLNVPVHTKAAAATGEEGARAGRPLRTDPNQERMHK